MMVSKGRGGVPMDADCEDGCIAIGGIGGNAPALRLMLAEMSLSTRVTGAAWRRMSVTKSSTSSVTSDAEPRCSLTSSSTSAATSGSA